MIILDAYAVLALLKGEPAATQVRDLLRGEAQAALTAIGVAEVIDHLVRLCGADEDEAALDVGQLGLAAGIAVDSEIAVRAGQLRAKHYHRRSRAVSLADCVAAATAAAHHAPVASADPHLLDLCHVERIGVIALQDSAGRVWTPDDTTRAPDAPG